MGSLDDKIINILEGERNPTKDIVQKIQLMLLYDCNQNVPSNYILEVAKNG